MITEHSRARPRPTLELWDIFVSYVRVRKYMYSLASSEGPETSVIDSGLYLVLLLVDAFLIVVGLLAYYVAVL